MRIKRLTAVAVIALAALAAGATGGAAAADPANVTVSASNGTEYIGATPPEAPDPPQINVIQDDGSPISEANITISAPGNVTGTFNFTSEVQYEVDTAGTYDVSVDGTSVGSETVSRDEHYVETATLNLSGASNVTVTLNRSDGLSDPRYGWTSPTADKEAVYLNYNTSTSYVGDTDISSDPQYLTVDLYDDTYVNGTYYFNDRIETIVVDGETVYETTDDDPLGGGAGGSSSNQTMILVSLGLLAAGLLFARD